MLERDEIIKQCKDEIKEIDYMINNLEKIKESKDVVKLPNGNIMNNIAMHFKAFARGELKNIYVKYPSEDKETIKHLNKMKDNLIKEIEKLEKANIDYILKNYIIIHNTNIKE